MVKIKKLISVLFILAVLKAEYTVENAFPNLSFTDPVGVYHADDGTDRLFVLEQTGTSKVFSNDPSIETVQTFLNITSIVEQDGGYTEEGLLGLAFHPNFSENGYFYVNYTKHGPRRNVIARYMVSSNPNQAEMGSSLIILEVNQPYTNHNGGQMGFGSDNYLYISFGDGGSAGDPQGNGQNMQTLLGTIIRIDVDSPSNGQNYSIPGDNPFIETPDARDEIYAYGLRNMWRFSWDPITGSLWGADVGQYNWEEIDIIYPGLNYGWNTMEGNHCYPAGSNCNSDGFEPPVFEYALYVDGVCSVTGGYVYRGNAMLSLYGKYIYGDWCTGDIWALTYSDSGSINEHLIESDINITSFGLDLNNELLICANSKIYKLTSDEPSGMMGDLNQDGLINVQDIILSINIILGATPSDYQLWSGDLNQDGVMDILDIVLLINLILSS